MSNKKSVAIIGCGAFGAMSAIRLAENDFDVTVFESNSECLRGASYNNQNRLHLVFHYPRDIETARQCIKGFERFKNEFSECISSDFQNYYFISSKDSLTNKDEYRNFCKQLGNFYEEVSLEDLPLDIQNINYSIICDEVVYDCNILRDLILQRLKECEAKLITKTKVESINLLNKKYTLSCSDEKEYNFDHVINCSYADINRLTKELGYEVKNVQFEYTFIPIVKIDTAKVGLTIMDGPFMTLLPFGKSDNFLLYHVEHSVLSREDNINLSPLWLSMNNSPINKINLESKFISMLNDCSEYIPILSKAEMIDFLHGPRMVKAKSDKTDARPSIIDSYEHGYHTVFSGKIDHCVWVADELVHRLRT